MTKKLLLAFTMIGLAVASAKTYTVNLYQTAKFGNTELQAGTYTVEVKDAKAIIRNGKVLGEAPVKVETGDQKYSATTVRFDTGNGQMKIEEIRLGGTKSKLILSE
jgi:hypothetical protein